MTGHGTGQQSEDGYAMRRPLFLGVGLLCPLALLMFSLLLASQSALGSTELLINGGFEDGTTGWSAHPYATFTITDFAHSGEWAASLNKVGLANDVWIRQNVNVTGQAAYTLTGWVYENGEHFNQSCLRIEWLNSSYPSVQKCLDGDAPYYRPITVHVGAAPYTGTARIKAVAVVGSTDHQEPVYFDDLSLTSNDPATPTPVPSPSIPPTSTPIPVYVPLVLKSYSSGSSPVALRATLNSAPPLDEPTSALISEVLYDGTIAGTEGDEFVELRNPGSITLDLTGYRIGDEERMGGSEGMYYFPAGTIIPMGECLVVAKNAAQFRERFGFDPDLEMRVTGGDYQDTPAVPNMVRDTGWGSGSWSLNNDGDEVLLLDPDGEMVDAISYEDGDSAAVGVTGHIAAEEPLSLQRVGTTDSDDMQVDFAVADPNPGVPTLVRPTPSPTPTKTPAPTPTPTATYTPLPTLTSTPSPPPLVTIGQARGLAEGVQVILEGQVTVPAGVFGPQLMYVQHEGAGILLYLQKGEYPPLREGDWVQLLGETAGYHGDRELKVPRGEDVQFLREGQPLTPLQIGTGEVGEAREGLLVQVQGSVVDWERDAFSVDDGTGQARVYIREATAIERPRVEEGEVSRVVGIVSQYARAAPYEGGYRLLPRYQADMVRVTALASASSPAPSPTAAASPSMSSPFVAAIHLGIAYLFLPALL